MGSIEQDIKAAEEEIGKLNLRLIEANQVKEHTLRAQAQRLKEVIQVAEKPKRLPAWLEAMELDLRSSFDQIKNKQKKLRIEASEPVQDDKVYRLSPGARSRATHKRVMLGAPILVHYHPWLCVIQRRSVSNWHFQSSMIT